MIRHVSKQVSIPSKQSTWTKQVHVHCTTSISLVTHNWSHSTHHSWVNWQGNPCLAGKNAIYSYQSKSSSDIVNLLLWGEKSIQKNVGSHNLPFSIQSCCSYYARLYLCQRPFYKIFVKFRNSKKMYLKLF